LHPASHRKEKKEKTKGEEEKRKEKKGERGKGGKFIREVHDPVHALRMCASVCSMLAEALIEP
jgi:hypothetical protein